jgi:hypothetical protein
MPVYHYLKTLFYIDPKAIPPVLLAYLLGKCWEKHLKPVRGKWLRDSNLSLARASTSHPPTSLVKRSWHIIKLMVLLSITSSGWAWVLADWLWSLVSTPIPPLAILLGSWIVVSLEVNFVLVSLSHNKLQRLVSLSYNKLQRLVNKLQRLVGRLRRQPIWRDTPDLELQMLERELSQFHNGTLYPPTYLY